VHERPDESQRGRTAGYSDPEADADDGTGAERRRRHDQQHGGGKRTEVEEEALVWCRWAHVSLL